MRITKARADLRTLASAAAIYAAHAGILPANLNNLTVTSTVNGKAIPKAMSKLPTKPDASWTTYTLTRLVPTGTFQITTSSKTDKASVTVP